MSSAAVRLRRAVRDAWAQPRPLELGFVLAVLAAVLVYVPLRLGVLAARRGPELALAPHAMPVYPFETADIDPTDVLRPPETAPKPVRPAYDAAGRNFFAYGTPPPRPTLPPTPIPEVTPELVASVTPTPPPPTPTPTPPWPGPKVKLIGLFGYRDAMLAAFKDEQSNEVYVGRLGQVVEVQEAGKIKERFIIAAIGPDVIEVRKADDDKARKNLKLDTK